MSDRVLNRRTLLRRGGAVAAGLAGAGAASVLPSPVASAADGTPVELGLTNTASTTTTVTGTSHTAPTVSVASVDGTVAPLNVADKPYPRTGNPDTNVQPGDLLSRDGLLYYGHDAQFTGTVLTDYIMPFTSGINPQRQLDTRSAASRACILNPAGNLDSAGRVLGGHTIYVVLGSYANQPTAVFGNLTAYVPLGPGLVTMFPYGTRQPITTNVNFAKGGGAQNSFVVGTGQTAQHRPAISVYASGTTHLIIDVTALTDYVYFAGVPASGPAAAAAGVRPARQSRFPRLRRPAR